MFRVPKRSRLDVSILVAFFLLSAGNVLAQSRPFIPLHTVDMSSSEYARFKSWVDRAVAGNPGWGFSATDAAIMYRLTGEVAYAYLAISMVESNVQAAEAAIAAGNRPGIAADSYLEVGNYIRDLAIVYDWIYDRLAASQRTRWASYAEQAVWNVWNHTSAQWGGKSFPWTGWSRDNPGNNYYYSFIDATMYWGLASQNSQWLNFLRNDRFPLLVGYFTKLPGGGSREGTGYGTSHKRLFSIYRVWQEATGENLASLSSHTQDSIEYWMHATTPTLDRLAPIGDHARDSTASLYDYHEHLMLELVHLYQNTPQGEYGAWWLNHNSVVEMMSGFNFRHALLKTSQVEKAPTALFYHATGVGHLFARSSWQPDAFWISFVAGVYEESHAHQDQGSFTLYQNTWLAIDENIHSHSGIEQDSSLHNLVRFEKGGTTIQQRSPTTSTVVSTDQNGVLTLDANLTPAYGASQDVRSWRRNVVFDRGNRTVKIHDLTDLGSGVSAIWQINTESQPVISGNAVIAGNLQITSLLPSSPQITIVDWRTQSGGNKFNGGWRIELRGATEYDISLSLVTSPPSDSKVLSAPTIVQKKIRRR